MSGCRSPTDLYRQVFEKRETAITVGPYDYKNPIKYQISGIKLNRVEIVNSVSIFENRTLQKPERTQNTERTQNQI